MPITAVQGLRGSVEAKVSVEEKGTGADTLIIRVKVLAMDPGSKAARYWQGSEDVAKLLKAF